ncbi:IS3 family transposase [Rathayibacter iranicus]|uniref:IS3 family transposase n=1 Tax=Rathayibacter iranicus TaxID=59737 RepID=UPI000CE72913|nr:IS3 family transposase [Rathayibacter iranicus]PPI40620.1 IS3 family transposase [Rathayibacter iranicus]
MSSSRGKYSPEFRAEAVREVIDKSRPVADVARDLGLVPQTLTNWVAADRRSNGEGEEELTVQDRARIKELERRIRELEAENLFLGKSVRVLREEVALSTKLELIQHEEREPRQSASIREMCQIVGVNRSSYYEWRDRKTSATAQWRTDITKLIRKAFTDSDGTYGYRRVSAQLARWGRPVADETVRRLMRAAGLEPCQPKPWRPTTTIPGDPADIPDLVKRNFTAEQPGCKWVGDITYIRTWEGWVYLATVLDCYSKKVVGYALADHMRTELVTEALEMAARNQPYRVSTTIFHSDRGSVYTSAEFGKTAKRLDIRQSMGRTGVCWDNAWAESFNGTLKNERCNRTQYPTKEKATRDVARYIELQYNQKRLHSGLDYRTPNEAEQAWLTRDLAA